MNLHEYNNIILLGMPGAGKSTVGILLAKAQAKNFIDTDLLIQRYEQTSLQNIIDKKGYIALREIEELILLQLQCEHTVVATGGSVIYSVQGMKHLQCLGPVVFLDVSLSELSRRITDYDQRGIAGKPEQSFEQLFDERRQLYLKYADITINCNGSGLEQVMGRISSELNLRNLCR